MEENAVPKENEAATRALDCCFKVHRTLGPGLLESVYCAALADELDRAGIVFVREEPIHVVYDSHPLGIGFRADFIVEGCLLLEVKSVDNIAAIHKKQLLNYLRLANLRLGLLLNFNTTLLKNGLIRIANNLPDES